jgi:ribonuclease P protein component
MKQTLKSQKITDLFQSGKWIRTNSVSAIYTSSEVFSYMVSAPSKKFKKATDRNKIKRMLRNAISKNSKKPISIAFIYSLDKIIDTDTIIKDVQTIFNII